MTTNEPRRILVSGWPAPSDAVAARVLDQAGAVVGIVPEPMGAAAVETLRDAIVDAVLDTDFGDSILAGVAFAPHLGGDAIGFT